MAIDAVHYRGNAPVDAIKPASYINLTTAGTGVYSSTSVIGASLIEVVSTQPIWLGTGDVTFAESDMLAESPLLWLDATNLAATYTDGDDVTSWADASGNSFDADEATDCPSYDEDGLDGTLPSVHFDGTEFLNSAITASSNDFTTFIVGKLDNASGSAYLLDYTANGTVAYDADNDKFDYFTSTTNATDAGVVQDSPFLLTVTSSGIWQNGEELQDTMTIADAALTAVAIGSNAANDDNFVDGEISAVLVFAGELTTDLKERVEWYLANKFDITLDSSHTYYANFPKVQTVSATTGMYIPANTVRRIQVDSSKYVSVIRAGFYDADVNITIVAEV